MAYTAELVDTLFEKFEKCAQRQNTNKASDVKLRAAERDLLQVAEKVRDLLLTAVKGDRALLSEVFGGSCRRFHGLREAIDTVEFSDMHANDQRWRHLSAAMVTVEEVLKQLGMFKPSQLEKKASLKINAYRGLRGHFLPGQRVTMKPECEGCKAEVFSVEPALPSGLALNTSTGEIAGMLRSGMEVPEQTYVITAQGQQGEATFELRFSVAPPAPRSLGYAGLPPECYTGEVVIWAAEVQGGAPREWSVNPALPAGLALDKRTGAIAGTPSATSETTEYTIVAANSSGQAAATFRFGVRLAPPVGLNYPGAEEEYLIGGVVYLTPEVALKTSEAVRRTASAKWQSVRRKLLTPNAIPHSTLVKMPAMRFSVEPALPEGLVLAPKTGRILGTPIMPTEEATYCITCRNDGGEISTALRFAVRLKPPTSLQYPEVGSVYYTRRPMTLSPKVDGLVSEWQVVPELPVGLHLDPVMGIISGMPLEVMPESTWTVTARNAEGGSDAELTFAVQRAAPSGLAYPALEEEYPVRRSMAIQPTVDGEVEEYFVVPELPTGLELNRTTGVISGSAPVAADKASYTVTARNETGATSVTLTFALTVMPPQSLSYPQVDEVYSVGELVKLEPEVTGGPTSWSVEPPLPRGLGLDESTGKVCGAPVSIVDEASYVVTAANEAGGTSVVLTFSVTAPRPEGLGYPMACDEHVVGEQVVLEPELRAGCCLAFSVAPKLPRDLHLDPETGVISGTVTAATEVKTYRVTASNPTGSTFVDLTFACTTPVNAITGVNQHFAMMVEEITDLAEMVEEPAKASRLGDWMVWTVHRAWLNDPALIDVNFTGKSMPPPHNEPRIAPKLMKAMEHNTHIVSLQLANSNMMKPQGHQLADSLRKNTTLQLLNVETNSLDSACIKNIADGLKENPDSSLEQFKFSNQRSLGQFFGRPVEQALSELMEKNTRIVKLGFSCNDAHWRLTIDRAVLRNNDLARRRRKGTLGGIVEDEVVAQEKTLSRLVLTTPPDAAAWEVFDEEDERAALVRGYLVASQRLPTKEQLQSFARGRGKPLPYSAVAPLTKAFRAKLLDAVLGSQVTAVDAYGASSVGTLRAWSEKNEHWSLDVWQPEGARFTFTADRQPIIEVSQEVAAWQQPVE